MYALCMRRQFLKYEPVEKLDHYHRNKKPLKQSSNRGFSYIQKERVLQRKSNNIPEIVREYLIYNPESRSGLTWIKNSSRVNLVGKDAGYITTDKRSGDKRWQVQFKGKIYYCHRIIFFLHNGTLDETLMIDHIDGNPSNNLIENLREVSSSINMRNMKRKKSNKTGHSGITFYTHHLGYSYFIASWIEGGKRKQKGFSVLKFGEDRAKELAVNFLDQKMATLINCGEGFTERHGKPDE